jgi:hypothetical protein
VKISKRMTTIMSNAFSATLFHWIFIKSLGFLTWTLLTGWNETTPSKKVRFYGWPQTNYDRRTTDTANFGGTTLGTPRNNFLPASRAVLNRGGSPLPEQSSRFCGPRKTFVGKNGGMVWNQTTLKGVLISQKRTPWALPSNQQGDWAESWQRLTC